MNKRDYDAGGYGGSIGGREYKRARNEVLPPSPIVHCSSLPDNTSEAELRTALSSFGMITNVIVMHNKKQAFIEFKDISSAEHCVEVTAYQPVKVRSSTIFIQFSRHQKLNKLHSANPAERRRGRANSWGQAGYGNSSTNSGYGNGSNEYNEGNSSSYGMNTSNGSYSGGKSYDAGYSERVSGGYSNSYDFESVSARSSIQPIPASGNILLVEVTNIQYDVSLDTFVRVFGFYGKLQKIVMFSKYERFQALLQFEHALDAQEAVKNLDGANIYAGCCMLKIQTSRMTDLNVKYNNSQSWDYTRPDLPTGPSTYQGGGGVLPHPEESASYTAHGSHTQEYQPTQSQQHYLPPVTREASYEYQYENQYDQLPYQQPPQTQQQYQTQTRTSSYHSQQEAYIPAGQSDEYSGGNSRYRTSNSNNSYSYNRESRPSEDYKPRTFTHDSTSDNRSRYYDRRPTAYERSSTPSYRDRVPSPPRRQNMQDRMRVSGGQTQRMDRPTGRSAALMTREIRNGVALNRQNENDTKVAIVTGLHEQDTTCDQLFTLFGCYGDVDRVKIMYNKKNTALIQFHNFEDAIRAIEHLNGVKLNRKKMTVRMSLHSTVQKPPSGSDKPSEDGRIYTKDYEGSLLHRYKRAGSKNLHNIVAPAATLHLSNLPADCTEEMLLELFDGIANYEKIHFFPNSKPGAKVVRRMCLIQFASVDEAITALLKRDNHKFEGSNHFMRVMFSKSEIKSNSRVLAPLNSDATVHAEPHENAPTENTKNGEGQATRNVETSESPNTVPSGDGHDDSAKNQPERGEDSNMAMDLTPPSDVHETPQDELIAK
eukprot:CFRG1956T1